MTIAYGLTQTGFVAKSTDVVRQQINANLQASYGASFDVSDASVAGELAGITAAAVGDAWDGSQGASAAFDPDGASGSALDALSALTGTFRAPLKSSTFVIGINPLTLTGTPSTPVAQGSLAAATSTGAQFATAALAIITTVSAWTPSTTYAVGARATNGGNVYQCTAETGPSAGSGGPSGTGTAITDGGVTWRWLGAGGGAVDVTATSVDPGPIVGASGDVTVIATPVGGWSNVVNLLDATLGALQQGDSSLRATRTAELASSGSATADAIRAELLEVPGVAAASVIVNNTDGYSGGAPPHSIECIVIGGTDLAVAQAIFSQVAAGIATIGIGSGATLVTVTDSQGQPQVIQFTRPTQTLIYVAIAVTYDPSVYATSGDALVAEAVADWGNARGVGADSVAVALGAQAFTVPGVLDVPRTGSLGGTLISTSASPTSDATIVIDQRHIAVYDTSRVSVTSTAGSP